MAKATGKLWHRIKWWLLKPISKATFYWQDSGAAIHVMYFHDNSIYVRLIGRTGYEIALILPEEYVRDIKEWLGEMFVEKIATGGKTDAGDNKKIVPISRKLSLHKPPTRPT